MLSLARVLRARTSHAVHRLTSRLRRSLAERTADNLIHRHGYLGAVALALELIGVLIKLDHHALAMFWRDVANDLQRRDPEEFGEMVAASREAGRAVAHATASYAEPERPTLH